VLYLYAPEGHSLATYKIDVSRRPKTIDVFYSGFTDAEGKFQLISINPNDGAPPAHYKVLIQWPGGPKNAMGGLAGSGPDQLQGRYMNLEKTPFSVEIKPGSNDLPPFEVKSK